jgi:hypothetical protein
MLPTACKPAIASLRDSWKRKEKEGKTSETNLVSNGTTTNTKTGHTHTQKKKEKLWQYWQYKGSTSFNMHAQDFTRVYVTPEESHLNLGLSWSASSSRT